MKLNHIILLSSLILALSIGASLSSQTVAFSTPQYISDLAAAIDFSLKGKWPYDHRNGQRQKFGKTLYQDSRDISDSVASSMATTRA